MLLFVTKSIIKHKMLTLNLSALFVLDAKHVTQSLRIVHHVMIIPIKTELFAKLPAPKDFTQTMMLMNAPYVIPSVPNVQVQQLALAAKTMEQKIII